MCMPTTKHGLVSGERWNQGDWTSITDAQPCLLSWSSSLSRERPQVRPAQREVRREIPGARNEGATPNARPLPIIDVTRASIDVG